MDKAHIRFVYRTVFKQNETNEENSNENNGS